MSVNFNVEVNNLCNRLDSIEAFVPETEFNSAVMSIKSAFSILPKNLSDVSRLEALIKIDTVYNNLRSWYIVSNPTTIHRRANGLYVSTEKLMKIARINMDDLKILRSKIETLKSLIFLAVATGIISYFSVSKSQDA